MKGRVQRRIQRAWILLAIAACASWPARSVFAVDHTNLEEGLPAEVTDAYPLEYLGREVQGRIQYRYTASAEHELWLEPRFEFGFPRNGQVSLKVPLFASFAGDDSEINLGRTSIELMYNFNQETLSIPALALAAGVEAPDTRDGGSFDPFGRAILTKMIPGSSLWHRVHLNALLQFNVAQDEEEGERELRYVLVVGYDVRLGTTVTGVIDAVRERPLLDEPPGNYGELGVRLQLTPLIALAFGGGAGASDEGRFIARATTAFQWFAF